MKKILSLLLLLPGFTFLFGQDIQLTYLKTTNSALSLFHSESTDYFRNLGSSATDASILPGAPYAVNPEINGNIFVFYDNHLSPISHLEISQPWYANLRPLNKNDDHYLLYNPGHSPDGTIDINTHPPLSNSSGSTGAYYLLDFDTSEGTVNIPFNCQCPDYQGEFIHLHMPYNNFRRHIGLLDANALSAADRMAQLNDGSVVTVVNIYYSSTVNNLDEYILEPGDLWGSVWVKIDPTTGLHIPSPLFSDDGIALTFTVHGAEDGEHIFRTGALRGENITLSPDGTMWSSPTDQDSLFHFYMVKENGQGENLWTAPLFSYENTELTESSNFTFTMSGVAQVVELNDDIYVSLAYGFNNDLTDSLYFNDYFTDEGLNGAPEGYSPIAEEMGFVSKHRKELIRINENGEKISKLMLPFRDPDRMEYYNRSRRHQPNVLYKINDKLAWPHVYSSVGDTTLHFIQATPDGSLDSTGVDLPAGMGAFVLWLDNELNIVEHTNFPFDNSYGNTIGGLNIHTIQAVGNDSLLISGGIVLSTTTSLDPSGIADEITYDAAQSFVALYSVPDFLVSEKGHRKENFHLSVFPNPASTSITLKAEFDTPVNYSIIDMMGRAIKKDKIPASQTFTEIDLAGYAKGIYFVVVSHENEKIATAKIVVQ